MAVPSQAAVPEAALPGAERMVPPPEVPTSSFAARSSLAEAVLSPDGRRFVVNFSTGKRHRLLVYDAETLDVVKVIDLGELRGLNWIRWAGNGRILVSIERDDKIYGIEFGASRLFMHDLSTGETRYVGPKRIGIDGDNVIHLDRGGEFLLLSVRPSLRDLPRVMRFDLGADADPKGEVVQQTMRGVTRWWADDAGVVRMGAGWRAAGKWTVFYRSGSGEKLSKVLRFDRDDERLDYWQVTGIRAGSDEGYILVAGDSGRVALRKWNFRTAVPGEIVYENGAWDVDSAVLGEDGRPVLARFTDDAPRVHWLDPQMAALQKRLDAVFPQKRLTIFDFVKGERMLVVVGDEGDPGTLYVHSPRAATLAAVAPLRPEIDPAILVRPTAVSIPMRDGTEIRAYLTLPKGREAKGLPLIIMPHGGPYGVRDALVYDDLVQLLANRGYAVLQPNYRGSGGYGEAFEALGDGQIGRGMQDDLDDTMDWAMDQGLVARDRVCVMGISYGGYAALWAAIRNPERYACAISYAGVTDLKKQLAYDSDFLASRSKRQWKRKVRGEDGFDLNSVSPARTVARLKVPVFIAHGTEDGVVPFAQYKDFVNAAKDARVEIETLELEDEIHGFREQKSEQLWFDRVLDFLARNNPA